MHLCAIVLIGLEQNWYNTKCTLRKLYDEKNMH